MSMSDVSASSVSAASTSKAAVPPSSLAALGLDRPLARRERVDVGREPRRLALGRLGAPLGSLARARLRGELGREVADLALRDPEPLARLAPAGGDGELRGELVDLRPQRGDLFLVGAALELEPHRLAGGVDLGAQRRELLVARRRGQHSLDLLELRARRVEFGPQHRLALGRRAGGPLRRRLVLSRRLLLRGAGALDVGAQRLDLAP